MGASIPSGDFIGFLRKRLDGLLGPCEQAAAQAGGTAERIPAQQQVFSDQLSIGQPLVGLESLRILKGRIEIDVRFSEVNQNPDGTRYAVASVDRKLDGFPIRSPRCWTCLDNADDLNWYCGAVGSKAYLIDPPLIVTWLCHSGPPPR